jgi:hypothetical protein
MTSKGSTRDRCGRFDARQPVEIQSGFRTNLPACRFSTGEVSGEAVLYTPLNVTEVATWG